MKIQNRRLLKGLFFSAVVFLSYKIYSAGIAIDTRSEKAVVGQVNQAFVFDTTQVFTSQKDYAIGTVEFRKGVQASASDMVLNLGATPRLSGIIGMGPNRAGKNYSIMSYNILSDTTFGGVFFGGSANSWNARFSFLTTSTLYLETDLILTNTGGMNFSIFTTTAPGTIDARGNKIIVLSAGIQAIMASNKLLTFKDAKFLIQNLLGIIQSGSGSGINMRDVELIAQFGQTAFFYGNYNFFGTRNVLGYSGFIAFAGSTLLINSQSRVYVAPGTTVVLGLSSGAYVSPPISFTNATSELYLDNCTIDFSPQSGSSPSAQTISFTKGTIYINGNVTFKSTNGVGTFQFGDGASQANNCNVIILPGSKLILGTGVTLNYKNI